MTSRERIKRTLEFKVPDRVGIYDCLCGETVKLWGKSPGFFGFDLALFESGKNFQQDYKSAKEKSLFLALALPDPFQRAADILGLQNLLLKIAQDPQACAELFAKNAEYAIQDYKTLKKKNFAFDGVWIWADLAYKNGLYFSTETYKKLLFVHHKELFSFFEKEGMPVIFHCDGNCKSILPLLIEAGIKAINPLEINSGFDIESLKSDFGKELVIFGNMPTGVLEKNKPEIERVLLQRLEIAKRGGGFIYHGDRPVPATVKLENYEFALEIIKRYGSY